MSLIEPPPGGTCNEVCGGSVIGWKSACTSGRPVSFISTEGIIAQALVRSMLHPDFSGSAMSHFFPHSWQLAHTAFVGDQPYARALLGAQILYRGLETGANLGPAFPALQHTQDQWRVEVDIFSLIGTVNGAATAARRCWGDLRTVNQFEESGQSRRGKHDWTHWSRCLSASHAQVGRHHVHLIESGLKMST